MIYLALNVLAFLFLAAVALAVLGMLALIPRRGWQILGAIAGAFVLLVLYLAAPDALATVAGAAAMFGLAALICLGLDGVRKRWRAAHPVNPDDLRL